MRRHSRVDKVSGCCEKVSICCRPFSIIFGIIFLLISLTIITSFVLTNINKISNSVSHFVLKYPSIFNPVDSILTFFSRVKKQKKNYFIYFYFYILFLSIYYFLNFSIFQSTTFCSVGWLCLCFFVFLQELSGLG